MKKAVVHPLDLQVLSAIESHDLPRLNETIKAAAQARTPEWQTFAENAHAHDSSWRDAAMKSAESNRPECALLLNAWTLNEQIGNERSLENLRSSYAICRSLKGAFGGHALGFRAWKQETMGFQAGSTEEMCADWRGRIHVVRFSMDSSTLIQPNCEVIESEKGKFSFPSDDDESSDFGIVRARTHSRAYIEVANYSFYDDNSSNYRAHGCLFIAKTPHDMDAWIETRPSLQAQFAFFRSVDRHALEQDEEWTKEQIESVAKGITPLRQLRAEVELNDRPMPLRQDKHRPIAMACQLGSIPTVEFLLENGANPFRTPCDEGALSPLDAAATYGHPEVIKLLATKYGVDVNEPDARGITPLMRAVQERRIDAAQTLIDLGASLDCVSHDGVDLIQRARLKACVFNPYDAKPLPTEQEMLALIQANQARSAISKVMSLGKAVAQAA